VRVVEGEEAKPSRPEQEHERTGNCCITGEFILNAHAVASYFLIIRSFERHSNIGSLSSSPASRARPPSCRTRFPMPYANQCNYNTTTTIIEALP
jgi:hypothetical protein